MTWQHSAVVRNLGRVSVLVTTFERIIEVMRALLSPNDEEMNDLVDDFEACRISRKAL